MANLSTLIKAIKGSGLTEAEIAQHVGCSQATINRVEHGIHVNPTYKVGSGLENLYAELTVAQKPTSRSLPKRPQAKRKKKAAARAMIGAEEKEQLVTKADLRAELAELKAELIKWNISAMAAS